MKKNSIKSIKKNPLVEKLKEKQESTIRNLRAKQWFVSDFSEKTNH